MENERSLLTGRADYMRSLLPLLDPLIPLSHPLLPSSCIFTDILSYIRSMVLADDILEAEYRAATERCDERINRKTGRPVRITDALKREEYPRYFAAHRVGPDGEEVARTAGVDC